MTLNGQPADSIIWTIGVNSPRFRARLDTTNAVAESNEANNEMIEEFRPMIPVSAPIPNFR